MMLNIDPNESLKKKIAYVEKLITFYTDIVEKYPLSEAYKENLATLQSTRASLTNQIGKKNRG